MQSMKIHVVKGCSSINRKRGVNHSLSETVGQRQGRGREGVDYIKSPEYFWVWLCLIPSFPYVSGQELYV